MDLHVKPADYVKQKVLHVAFSGGRTSAYMLRRLLDVLPAERLTVLFANTGKEVEATLDFVAAVQSNWKIPVVWLEYDRIPARSIDLDVFPTPRRRSYVKTQADRNEDTHWFKVVNHATASRKGEPFEKLIDWMSTLPNHQSRACSSQMKARTMLRYLWSIGVKEFTSFIGFRADESDRAFDLLRGKDHIPGNNFGFPLVEWEVTEADVMAFWAEQSFDLGIEQFEGNCDLCFEKSIPKRLEILRRNPKVADWWIEQEDKKSLTCGERGSRFTKHTTVRDLLRRASLPVVSSTPPDKQEGGMCGVCTDGTMAWPEDED